MALLNPPNVLSRIRETIRQNNTNDSKFVKNLLYFFEMHVPESVANGARIPYLYPLIISPSSITMSEPFTVERTHTNAGGLFVEESGIVVREISVSGTTGFKPREAQKLQSEFSSISFPGEGRSFSRTTAQFRSVVTKLSGQRHFHFLQDAVFRTYGDLKRDPATAEGTELFFHMVKDDERFRVIPQQFDMQRDASNPLMYNYTFRLLAVGPAEETAVGDSEDKEVVDKINDGFAVVKAGVAEIRAAIQDLSEVTEAVRTTVLAGAGVIADAGSIANSAGDFVDGVAALIDTPFAYIAQTKATLDTSLETFNKALVLGSSEEVPGSVLNSLRRMGDGLEMIGGYPELFIDAVSDAVNSYNSLQELSTSQSNARLAAASTTAPSTISAFSQLGSGLRPGDQLRANEELGLGRLVPKFASALRRVVEQDDTLENLASKFLGDARQWKYIAIFNNLKFPFISDEGLPFTVGIGDEILIPSTNKPVERVDLPATQGVDPVTESGPEQVLGRDFQMRPVKGFGGTGRSQYDIIVNDEQGSTDMKTVGGVPNLQQGLLSRLLTEKGNDILYRNLGVSRVVGLGLSAVDLEVARYRIVEAIQADPRITGVKRISIVSDDANAQPDALIIDLDAEVRNFNTPLIIKTAEG